MSAISEVLSGEALKFVHDVETVYVKTKDGNTIQFKPLDVSMARMAQEGFVETKTCQRFEGFVWYGHDHGFDIKPGMKDSPNVLPESAEEELDTLAQHLMPNLSLGGGPTYTLETKYENGETVVTSGVQLPKRTVSLPIQPAWYNIMVPASEALPLNTPSYISVANPDFGYFTEQLYRMTAHYTGAEKPIKLFNYEPMTEEEYDDNVINEHTDPCIVNNTVAPRPSLTERKRPTEKRMHRVGQPLEPQNTVLYAHSVPGGFAKQVMDTVVNRGSDYGTPAENHDLTASLWNAWLSRRFRVEMKLSAEDVCMLNVLQKTARLACVSKDDSWLDVCGYAENVAMLKESQRNR